jgi:hypothetical protein
MVISDRFMTGIRLITGHWSLIADSNTRLLLAVHKA